MKIKVREKRLQILTGRFVVDDDIIILPNYRIYKLKQVLQTFCLCLLLLVLCSLLYTFPKLPKDVHVEPIEKVYAIQDNDTSHYKAYVTSIFDKQYQTSLAEIDVCFGLDNQLDVRASLFGLFRDTIRVIPIAQDGVDVEYTKKVYEGDTLDEAYVKTYLKFKDGHRIEKAYNVTVPDGEVRGPVQLCVTLEQFNRFYITIEPIMSKQLVAEYDMELYEGDIFDEKHVQWYLLFDDDTRRQLDDVSFHVKTDADYVGKSVVLSGTSKYQSNDVTLKSTSVLNITGEYLSNDILYYGDVLQAADMNFTVEWQDGKVLYLSGSDIISQTLYAKPIVNLSTVYGDLTMHFDVIGVDTVLLQNQADTYNAGDYVSPIGFMFTYQDGTVRAISVSEVLLSDDWLKPLQAGINNYEFTYHGCIYKWSVNAVFVTSNVNGNFDDDVVVDGGGDSDDASNDFENEVVVTPDEDDSDVSDGDSDDDIIVEPNMTSSHDLTGDF